jgi:hypothetical protein
MDPIDGFYQAMDSRELLDTHGPALVAQAREILAANPDVRIAGLITAPDSPDAAAWRAARTRSTGEVAPPGVMVDLVPRESVEPLLKARVGDEYWLEQGWQPQTVLPVVASTRDGHRFGFFAIAQRPGPPSGM